MQAIGNKVHTTLKILDKSFSKSDSENYNLLMQFGLNGLSYAILDKKRNKFIALYKYDFQELIEPNLIKDYLKDVIDQDLNLKNKFRRVKCSYVTSKNTLVPAPLFDESKLSSYLKFNHHIDQGEKANHDIIQGLDSMNVYTIHRELDNTLNKHFQNFHLFHFSTPLIEGVLSQNKNLTAKKLIVNVQSNQFEVLLIEGKKLHLYNTFQYYSKEDFIYYILFVCDEMELNPETIDIEIVGSLEKTSELYKIAAKYVRKVGFGNRIDSAEYCFEIKDLPSHQNYNLFNLNLCE